jgi:long-chain fatty acid transport protein
MLPSVAYQVNKTNYIGASLAIGIQQFRAYGLQAFGPAPDGLGYTTPGGDKFTNEGNDYSYGAGVRLGWLGKFFDKRLNLGLNYASRVYMTEFDNYVDLFAEQGDFDIPENWSVGLAFKATDKLTIAADFQKIYYSDIASVGNPGPNPANPSDFFPEGCEFLDAAETDNTCALGRDDGMGFGWDDAEIYKIGFNYDYNPQWSFRAGYNYAEAPIQDDQVMFNFLAPAVVEHHITLGGSYRPSRNMEWSFNYMHAFSNTIKGPTVLGPAGGEAVVGDNGSIDMHINSFGVSFGYML